MVPASRAGRSWPECAERRPTDGSHPDHAQRLPPPGDPAAATFRRRERSRPPSTTTSTAQPGPEAPTIWRTSCSGTRSTPPTRSPTAPPATSACPTAPSTRSRRATPAAAEALRPTGGLNHEGSAHLLDNGQGAGFSTRVTPRAEHLVAGRTQSVARRSATSRCQASSIPHVLATASGERGLKCVSASCRRSLAISSSDFVAYSGSWAAMRRR